MMRGDGLPSLGGPENSSLQARVPGRGFLETLLRSSMGQTESGASLVAQMVKNLPEMQETQVRSLGWEDSLLEKRMATHSSILAWRTTWTDHGVAKRLT